MWLNESRSKMRDQLHQAITTTTISPRILLTTPWVACSETFCSSRRSDRPGPTISHAGEPTTWATSWRRHSSISRKTQHTWRKWKLGRMRKTSTCKNMSRLVASRGTQYSGFLTFNTKKMKAPKSSRREERTSTLVSLAASLLPRMRSPRS